MNVQKVLKLFFFCQLSAIATSATTPVVIPSDICTTLDGVFKITCRAKSSDQTETLEVFCELQNGTRVQMSAYFSRLREVDLERFQLKAILTVEGLKDGAFRSCECAVMKNGDVQEKSRANIWIRNNTIFDMAEDIVITLGEEFNVPLKVKCDLDGSFEVSVVRGNGDSRKLRQSHVASPDGLPYIKLRALQNPDLHFPNTSCRDTGLYQITYLASRNYVPIRTQLDLRVRANDASCPDEVTTIKVTPNAESHRQATEPDNSGNTSTCTGSFVALGVLLPVLVCVIIGLIFYIYRQKKMLTREANKSNNRMTEEAKELNSSEGNDAS